MLTFTKVVVPVAGTPVSLASAIANSGVKPVNCHNVTLQALPSNTGKIYIGRQGLVKATYVGVGGYIPVPTANVAPQIKYDLPLAPDGISLNQIFIDADNSNDGVLMAYTVL